MKITKIGSWDYGEMLDSKNFNHGNRGRKIRNRFFRSLKRRLKRILDKQDYE